VTAQWLRGRGGRVARIATYAIVVAAFLASLDQYYHRLTGFTELIAFGDQFEGTMLPVLHDIPIDVHYKSAGYDGQFYAQLAVEPLLRNRQIDRALDTAPYRARRIFFSWTAYALGLGRPRWIVNAYAAQNIIAWLLLAWLLLRWFPPTAARNVVPWFGCLFGVGLATSFRFALLEGPGMVLITLAVAAVERRRTWLAAGLMGLVGLGRETNLVACTMLIDRLPRTWASWLRLAGQGIIAAAPFVLWTLYLRSVYPNFALSNPASFSLPLAGYLMKWRVTLEELWTGGWWTYARFNLLWMIGLTTQLGFLLARREWTSPWWRVGVVYCALLPFLSYLVWDGYPGAAPRVLLPLCFAFNVLVTRSRWFWPLVILGNLSVIHGIPMIGVPWISRYF